jgi:hypothetical protein
VAGALGALLLLALAVLGAFAGVGTTEGILGLLALLADVSLVHHEDPEAVRTTFPFEEQAGDVMEDGPVLRPP